MGSTRESSYAIAGSKLPHIQCRSFHQLTRQSKVWEHQMSTYTDPLGFMNYGYDQVMAGKGAINYCVRWDSSSNVSAEKRATVESTLQRSFNRWVEVLAGFDGFPYDEVAIKVVGWAARNEGLLEGDTSGIDVYTTTDAEGIPQCSEECGRFFHQDGDYSACDGGADRHYGKLSSIDATSTSLLPFLSTSSC